MKRFSAAIVGAGPSGTALAILLARAGADVTLFDDGRRPELVVGESLVPAIVPSLARLGVEAAVADLGLLKPGVSFIWSAEDRASFTFARFAPAIPPYAYNVPRPRFDDLLLDAAIAAGARHARTRARLEPAAPGDSGPELRLADAPGPPPDLIVDATGRARAAGRALGIPVRRGPRDDVAHFAHFTGFTWDDPPGQVVISRLAAGWSWRIPLRDRLSVGIVLGRDDAARLGGSPEERLIRAIGDDSLLRHSVDPATRVTGVLTYANYQQISERGHGPGWVMVGDAFGFVDPMLSPGVFLAVSSAELVARVLAPFVEGRAAPTPEALERALAPCAARQRATLEAWMELVAHLYDGTLLALLRAGREWLGPRPGRARQAVQTHIERQVARQASGMATTARYPRALLRVLGRHGLRGVAPADLAIR